MSTDDRLTQQRSIDHDVDRKRFAVAGGSGADKGVLYYERDVDHLYLLHTEVRGILRGQGAAGQLISAAVNVARDEDLTVVPWCPFARRWLHEHMGAAQGVHIDFHAGIPDGLGR